MKFKELILTEKPLDYRADIRINRHVWEKFKELCGTREASDVVRDFVEDCVKKNVDLSGQKI